jgi:predicted Ser/Thr protein kinase
MNQNNIHKKLIEFAPQQITLRKFQELLESSSRSNKIRVEWETLEGNTDYYWMWWEDGPLATTEQGEEMSRTKLSEGMFNIQTTLTSESGRKQWRTLTLQTVSKCRFENKLYIVK